MLARQIAVGFGIAIILPLLVYYGVRTFYPPPVWAEIVTERFDPQASPEARQASNDKRRQQEQDYTARAKAFARVFVIISTPLGIAGIVLGAYLANIAIGTGLIIGGILTVVHGYFGYWNYAEDWLRFVSLLVGLAILLLVGYRVIGRRDVAA